MNQVIQRIGRVVRVYQGKRRALIYVVYISETKDDSILQIFRKAIELGGRTAVASEESAADDVTGQSHTAKEIEERRIKGAYNILEVNSYDSVITETNHEQKIFQIKSSKDNDKYYNVNAQAKTCTCPDFMFRHLKCKHITATEILDSSPYVHYPRYSSSYSKSLSRSLVRDYHEMKQGSPFFFESQT